jgi:hypothetical protein
MSSRDATAAPHRHGARIHSHPHAVRVSRFRREAVRPDR